MADTQDDGARTGLLLVDPSNDFLASEGKLWLFAKEVAEAVNLLSHLRAIVDAARQAGMQVFFVPHHRWEPGDYAKWKHANHTQIASGQRQTFAKDTWGWTFHDGHGRAESRGAARTARPERRAAAGQGLGSSMCRSACVSPWQADGHKRGLPTPRHALLREPRQRTDLLFRMRRRRSHGCAPCST